MFRSIEDIHKEKEEKEKIAKLPSIRKLKYLALFFIFIGIAIMLINLIWLETFSTTVILVLRGCAGICAIIFLIIIGIYMHKINTIYNEQRFRNKKDKYKFNEESKDC